MTATLDAQARRVVRQLLDQKIRVVLAESCTAGLVTATLARIPGVSDVLCGGMVVYRNATKATYLGISQRLLKHPGPVSEQVAIRMARNVLEQTVEASLSAAVTGHLGPHAPPKLDGSVYIGIATRRCTRNREILDAQVEFYHCRRVTRIARQREVAERVLAALQRALTSLS